MIKSLLYQALFILLLSSCKKKDQIDTVYAPAWLKQMVPYTNGQTLSFVNSAGGIINVNIEETKDFVTKSSCSGCSPYVREEIIKYRFYSGGTLNGRTFTNVLEITNGTPDPMKLYRAYYSISRGLVGYIYGNGSGYALN